MDWTENRIIVVPIDMSEFSLKAIQAASRMAGRPEQIRVLHVIPPLEPAETGILWKPLDDAGRIELTKKNVAETLEKHGYNDLSVSVRIGDPGTQIALFAGDVQAGLIVIPSHGRGMLTRLLLGSTTDRVVHLAPCPVLILKELKTAPSPTPPPRNE